MDFREHFIYGFNVTHIILEACVIHVRDDTIRPENIKKSLTVDDKMQLTYRHFHLDRPYINLQ